ncbi:MAG: ring-opening amidohydrolase [Thermomicrobiales bacterium]|nr:ring-opening amidohydrolase [Thermomicrobiales bacterium]
MTALTAVRAFGVPLGHESDTTGLARLVAEGELDPRTVVGVTGKVEGNWPGEETRKAADTAVRSFLVDAGADADQVARIPMIYSSGGVGIMTPHIVVYSRVPWDEPISGEPRLAVGIGFTPPVEASWIGQTRLSEECAAAVGQAMADADVSRDEVAFVLAKSPIPSAEQLDAAGITGERRAMLLPHISGGTALGIGVALGDLTLPDAGQIGRDMSIWTGRGSCSIGHEQPTTQVLLLANSPRAGGTLRVGTSVMEDMLDVVALDRALIDAGLQLGPDGVTPAIRERVVAVYLKISQPNGTLRGLRQTQDERNTRYGSELKAAVGGAFAGRLGHTAIYISSAAVHQGPPEGGTVAVVVDHG